MMNTLYNNNQLHELFYIIEPPSYIKGDVNTLKNDVHHLIGHDFKDDRSTAHLSLIKCFEYGVFIRKSLYQIQSRLQSISPFKITVKDPNIFRHGSKGSIFLEIVNKSSVCDVFERLVGKKVSFTPHITISRNLQSEDFERAWTHLKNYPYSKHFLCDHITVLLRYGHHWLPYDKIYFGK